MRWPNLVRLILTLCLARNCLLGYKRKSARKILSQNSIQYLRENLLLFQPRMKKAKLRMLNKMRSQRTSQLLTLMKKALPSKMLKSLVKKKRRQMTRSKIMRKRHCSRTAGSSLTVMTCRVELN